MAYTETTIVPDQRGLAAVTHLSGLAGYIIPCGGILVPIVIWIVKSDAPAIAAIARQAVLLNVAIFLASGVTILLFLTVVLIPLAALLAAVLAVVAVALPVVGAIKASEGTFFRYPLVGSL